MFPSLPKWWIAVAECMTMWLNKWSDSHPSVQQTVLQQDKKEQMKTGDGPHKTENESLCQRRGLNTEDSLPVHLVQPTLQCWWMVRDHWLCELSWAEHALGCSSSLWASWILDSKAPWGTVWLLLIVATEKIMTKRIHYWRVGCQTICSLSSLVVFLSFLPGPQAA